MLVEVLSAHPHALLARSETAIEDQWRRVRAHRRAVADLRAHHVLTRRWWQVGRWLRQRRELRELLALEPRVDPALLIRRERQRHGVRAEELVTAALERLGDDWLLFRGYANRRGEVDHLLVGPGGVWAIEVKSRGVVVHVHDDRWTFEKFDRYGNLVESGWLRDGGGRSWGRQVSDVAGELQRFLRSRSLDVVVRPAVAVVHERAELGEFHSARDVLLSIGADYLVNHVERQPALLDGWTRDRIAALVRRDHRFHEDRRGDGAAGSRRRRLVRPPS